MPLRLAAAALLAATLVASPAVAAPIETGQTPNCSDFVPAQASTATSPAIDLQTLVLVDQGVTVAKRDKAMSQVVSAYAPLGLRIVPEYRDVTFAGTDPDKFHEQAKALVGGRRPAGIDLVYVLTAVNLSDPVTGDGVAGRADCIGGIAHADQGFAVGEVDEYEIDGSIARDVTGIIAAHELGHLLGAHHHYANCAQGLLDPIKPGPCTVMINDVGLGSTIFGVVEAAVIRGYAEKWTTTPLIQPRPPVSSSGTPPRQPGPAEKPPAEKPPAQPQSQPAPSTSGSSTPAPASSGAANAAPCGASLLLTHTARRVADARSALKRARNAKARVRAQRKLAQRTAEARFAQRLARACR